MTPERHPDTDRLLAYLSGLPRGAPLPRMPAIGVKLRLSAARVQQLLDMLRRQGRIVDEVHGSATQHRGHRAIRLATGRELQTADCPLALPARPAGRSGATVRDAGRARFGGGMIQW